MTEISIETLKKEEHALYQVAIREIATRGAGKASERATTRFHLVSEIGLVMFEETDSAIRDW
jgi:hypothetical protein